MTSVPRGPSAAPPAAGAPPPPGAPPPGAAPAPRPPPAAPAGVGGRRFRNRCMDDAENAKVWMSCQARTVPSVRLRSSTRRGGGGGVVAAPRPPCGAEDGAPPASGGVAAGGLSPSGVWLPPRPRPRPPRPGLGSTWYASQRESGENTPPVAFATLTSSPVSSFNRCSTGFASAGTVFVSWRAYVTHFPSPEISGPVMLRHLE